MTSSCNLFWEKLRNPISGIHTDEEEKGTRGWGDGGRWGQGDGGMRGQGDGGMRGQGDGGTRGGGDKGMGGQGEGEEIIYSLLGIALV